MRSVFVGCSYTAGKGFELEKQQPELWVNLLHKRIPEINRTELINNGESGASNEKIFQNAVDSIVTFSPEYAFVQWTGSPRYNVNLGLETYQTNQYFSFDGHVHNHTLHSVSYSDSYLTNIRDRFLSLHHPHSGIVDIIKYTNILISLANLTGTRIFFINGLCPWDNNYFLKLTDTFPNNYTPYTKKLIETDTRDDSEAFLLYEKVHNDYAQAGSIQESHWVNLYNSFNQNKVDTNNDNTHPGIKSNQLYLSILEDFLITKL